MSNSGFMNCKSKCLSFINKGVITLLLGVSLIVIIPCSWFVFAFWSEMPILIKIFEPFLLTLIFIGMILTPFNGMFITKKGTVFFLPDFRLKKFKIKDLIRMALVFNEWENGKYSVMIKFVCANGQSFSKDYSKQFRNMANKKLTMSMYTIPKRKVEKICNELLDLNVCVTTIVDKHRNITYQSK